LLAPNAYIFPDLNEFQHHLPLTALLAKRVLLGLQHRFWDVARNRIRRGGASAPSLQHEFESVNRVSPAGEISITIRFISVKAMRLEILLKKNFYFQHANE
jgi:hypothetical protein